MNIVVSLFDINGINDHCVVVYLIIVTGILKLISMTCWNNHSSTVSLPVKMHILDLYSCHLPCCQVPFRTILRWTIWCWFSVISYAFFSRFFCFCCGTHSDVSIPTYIARPADTEVRMRLDLIKVIVFCLSVIGRLDMYYYRVYSYAEYLSCCYVCVITSQVSLNTLFETYSCQVAPTLFATYRTDRIQMNMVVLPFQFWYNTLMINNSYTCDIHLTYLCHVVIILVSRSVLLLLTCIFYMCIFQSCIIL